MYDKVFEQAGSFFKPMTDILELNVETLEALRTKQTDLINDVMSESLEYAQGVTKPNTDVDSFVERQTAYWESLRDKLTSNAQDSYEVISQAQGRVGELLQGAWDVNLSDFVAPAAPAAKTAAPAAKKKTAVKKTATKAKSAAKASAEEATAE